jgi:hypothetical protein
MVNQTCGVSPAPNYLRCYILAQPRRAPTRLTKRHPSFNVKCLCDTQKEQ